MDILGGIARSTRAIVERLVYPSRVYAGPDDLTAEEIEAWVEASAGDYFETLDQALVERARGLGVDRGMVLDLGSPLGLVAMKILWEQEDFLCMGVYRSLQVAERARQTAEEWKLGERMFFQVGEPGQMRFKTGYFDMVVSDGALHRFEDPVRTLGEIHRITKPTGAILIRELRRPSRLGISSHLARHGTRYDPRLRDRFETGVRAGFTPAELGELARMVGLEGAEVIPGETHVVLERRGINDPSSWVSEREKYF